MDESTPVPTVPAGPTAPADYVPPTPEKKAYLAALAAAQAEFLPIVRNRKVTIRGKTKDGERTEYTFDYAELGEILEKTRPACAKHGLSLRSRWVPGSEPGVIWIESILAHAEGFEDISAISLNATGLEPKTLSAQVSYVRRYMGTGQLGVAAEGDLDDDGSSGAGDVAVGGTRPAQKQGPQRKVTPAPRPAAAPAPAADGPPGDEPPVEGATTRNVPPAPPAAPAEAPAAERSAGAPPPPAAAPPAGTRMATQPQLDWLANTIASKSIRADELDKILDDAGIESSAGPMTAQAWTKAKQALLQLP